MGDNTKIEWADHTFNPWVGCAKVSPACTNCYAESWARRTGSPELWRGERRRTSAANWLKPLKWNRETPGARVFCSSLADVFEHHEGQQGRDMAKWRLELFELIHNTPRLTWMLLTKRPDKAASFFRLHGGVPTNVWVGSTVEDQQRADERIPYLLQVPAPVRFLSCEPLLGPVDLTRIPRDYDAERMDFDALGGRWHARNGFDPGWTEERIQWVIAGGESGPRARPSHPDWFRSLRDQCARVGVPFHFKQWGEWCEYSGQQRMQGSQAMTADGRCKVCTEAFDPVVGDSMVVRVGKVTAGRLLDGRTHDGVPEVTRG